MKEGLGNEEIRSRSQVTDKTEAVEIIICIGY
jgi:hypothetical protein